MSKVVLITGGSGLVGTRLTHHLLTAGYSVAHLGRSKTSKKGVKSYIWDIKRGIIEDGALENVNIVVHLAGAGVADKRWSKSRKRTIIDSRVNSTRLLYDKLAATDNPCEAVIAASAIGFYGVDTGREWVDENTPPGDGFLAEVTKLWESEIARFKELKLRVVTLRTGIVLSSQGGAFPKIAQPIRMNLGSVLGSGQQYMSWIHIDDLCGIIKTAMESVAFRGVYNAVAPDPVTNREFTQVLAQELNKSLWLPSVPAWVLQTVLGEMAQVVLGGNRVTADRVRSEGYSYKYPELQPALEAVLEGD